MISQAPIEFIIILTFTAIASLFVILMSIGLVVHKAVQMQKSWRGKRLYSEYAGAVAEILMHELPPLPAGSKTSAKYTRYDSLFAPLKSHLNAMSASRRKLHRAVLRDVLVEFARDLIGETSERLVYIFSSFGFVDDQLQLLQSRHWWMRAFAARELGVVKARKAITQLTFALEDPHHDVRTQATHSLVVLVGVDALGTIFRLGRNLSKWDEIELSVIVMRFKEHAVPYLIEALGSTDDSIVAFAIEMLAENGFVTAVDPLLRLAAEHPREMVQAKAVEALGRLGDGRAEPLLLKLALSEKTSVRMKAISALGALGANNAVPLLAQQFRVFGMPDKLIIACALRECGPQGIDFLRQIEKEGNPLIVGIVAEVLEEMKELSPMS